MAKRGERRPWRLTTTWAHADIKPFTETFRTYEGALSERIRRMRVDNVRGEARGKFVITNRDVPGWQAPGGSRCSRCYRWATEHGPDSLIQRRMCADHAGRAWAEHGLSIPES